MKRSNMMHYR